MVKFLSFRKSDGKEWNLDVESIRGIVAVNDKDVRFIMMYDGCVYKDFVVETDYKKVMNAWVALTTPVTVMSAKEVKNAKHGV